MLLFGELDEKGVPQAALAHFGSEAYEHYMVAPYVRELLMVRNTDYVCWTPCFEHLYAAILAFGAVPVQFEELGSTLFSTIDKFEKLDAMHQSLFRPLSLDLGQLLYAGIEVSQLLIDLAEALHPGRRLEHFTTWRAVPRPSPNIVSRSYQSTSYAFRETDELFDWLSQSKFGIHGVWWCVDGGQREVSMGGNRLTLFDPDAFDLLARKNGCRIRVVKSEIYSYGDVRFSASWVILSNFTAVEELKMSEFLEKMKLPNAVSMCGLNQADLSRQTYVGPHVGVASIKTNRPFDFRNEKLEAQFARYIGGT